MPVLADLSWRDGRLLGWTVYFLFYFHFFKYFLAPFSFSNYFSFACFFFLSGEKAKKTKQAHTEIQRKKKSEMETKETTWVCHTSHENDMN